MQMMMDHSIHPPYYTIRHTQTISYCKHATSRGNVGHPQHRSTLLGGDRSTRSFNSGRERHAAAAGNGTGHEGQPHTLQDLSSSSSSSSSSLTSNSGVGGASCGDAGQLGSSGTPGPLGQQQQEETAPRVGSSLSSVDVMSNAELAATAQRYAAVALLKGSIGCVLLLAPTQVAGLVHLQASSLEVGFARLTGMALLFRALLAACLRDAALCGRLHSTSCQRVMLGCLLPVVNHYLAFKKLMIGTLPSGQLLLYVYPVLLAVEFYAHIITFQVYQPYFLAKLLWPAAFGAMVGVLMPPLPDVQLQVPQAVSPVTAGGAVLLGQQGARQFGGRIGRLLARLLPKAGKGLLRSRASTRVFKWLMPAAGPPLTGTSVKLMDFTLPQSPLAWAYFFMMLGHFATVFNAYRAELLFSRQVTPLSQLLKQCWSAAFLAAAFTCDALKTAVDRQHLALQENRNLNLCLAALEVLFLACVGACLASGCIRSTPYSSIRLATSAASAAFCLKLWWDSTQEAGRKGWPQLPTVASLDWQHAEQMRPEYGVLSSVAVVGLTLMTAVVC